MANYYPDQAEGLRQLLAGSKPRVYTFLSAVGKEEKKAMFLNLATSLAQFGSKVLLLDACLPPRGVASSLKFQGRMTLLHVANRECFLRDALYQTPSGFGMAVLSSTALRTLKKGNERLMKRLLHTFEDLAEEPDVLLVDAELDDRDALPLPALGDTEIVVHVSDSVESIKEAYTLIKRVNADFGRRSFSLLITCPDEERAAIIYQNMAKTASRYLAIPLKAIGYLPHDARTMGLRDFEFSSSNNVIRDEGVTVAFRRVAEYFARTGVGSVRINQPA